MRQNQPFTITKIIKYRRSLVMMLSLLVMDGSKCKFSLNGQKLDRITKLEADQLKEKAKI